MDTLTKDSVMSLKVSELKSKLGDRGLATNGIKSALQKRLIAALAAVEPAPVAAAPAAEAEDTIDESTRYSGTVHKFMRRRGFGRIIPDGKTETDTDDLVFVHWKQIQSSDEWPTLADGQQVEYYLGTKANPRDPKKATFAAKVTGPGGQSINQADTRNFPNRAQRFAGTVEFFDARKGFGFLKPKEDFCFEETDFLASKKGTIYVCREDIKVADGVDVSPSLKEKAEVEFTLYKRDPEGTDAPAKSWAAGDVTNVGGEPLGVDDFKPRKAYDPNRPRQNKKRKRNQKGKKGQMFNMAKMMRGGNMQPQIVMMNGQAFMMMPTMNMGGNWNQQGRKKKKRKKNKAVAMDING